MILWIGVSVYGGELHPHGSGECNRKQADARMQEFFSCKAFGEYLDRFFTIIEWLRRTVQRVIATLINTS